MTQTIEALRAAKLQKLAAQCEEFGLAEPGKGLKFASRMVVKYFELKARGDFENTEDGPQLACQAG